MKSANIVIFVLTFTLAFLLFLANEKDRHSGAVIDKYGTLTKLYEAQNDSLQAEINSLKYELFRCKQQNLLKDTLVQRRDTIYIYSERLLGRNNEQQEIHL